LGQGDVRVRFWPQSFNFYNRFGFQDKGLEIKVSGYTYLILIAGVRGQLSVVSRLDARLHGHDGKNPNPSITWDLQITPEDFVCFATHN
jgi:hypothetical protein